MEQNFQLSTMVWVYKGVMQKATGLRKKMQISYKEFQLTDSWFRRITLEEELGARETEKNKGSIGGIYSSGTFIKPR